MNNSFLHRTCGPVRGTWDLGRPRPARPHPTPAAGPCLTLSHGGYAFPDRLQYSRLALYTPLLCIQFSTAYTILVRHHYNSRPTIQRWTCHTMLDRPCNSLPAMQLYTGEPMSREPVSREPMHPNAIVERVNAWNNCVTYISPPTGHLKLHTNYIYRSPKLHTNYIYQPGKYM